MDAGGSGVLKVEWEVPTVMQQLSQYHFPSQAAADAAAEERIDAPFIDFLGVGAL